MTATRHFFVNAPHKERLTCYVCRKRRLVKRWVVAGWPFGLMYPVCAEHVEFLPQEGRDYFVGEDEE